MDPKHRAVLRKHRLELSGQLQVSDTIVPFLYQEDILTGAQVEDIESRATERQKTLTLLDLLPNRGPRAFDAFLQSLQEYSWVRDRLLQEVHTPPGPESTEIPQFPDSILQKVPSDRELSRLASRLGAEWESVVLDLGLSAEAVFRCRSDHSLSSQAATLTALVQWRRSEGKRATVERLLKSLLATGFHPSVLEDVIM
ncbi:death domain-containing protein CRADD [Pholidichthys leucotaenia]